MKLRSSGTLGDTYICICHMTHVKEPIDVEHHTKHTYWHQEIRDIYSLLPQIRSVRFGTETFTSPYTGVHKKIKEFKPFPTFHFPSSRLDPGEPYTVLCPKSGKPNEHGRRIPQREIDHILETASMPVIVPEPGKTSLLEAMGLVARANKFYGVQGLMSFVALSHKTVSTVYVPNEIEYLAFRGRLARAWIAFLEEVKCGSSL